MTEIDLTEAKEVWREAFTRYNTTVALTVNGAGKADEAAARVIHTALAERDAAIARREEEIVALSFNERNQRLRAEEAEARIRDLEWWC